jgi:hypothetical protein
MAISILATSLPLTHLNVIRVSLSWSSNWAFSKRIPYNNIVTDPIISYLILAHCIFFGFTMLTVISVWYMKGKHILLQVQGKCV